MTSIFVGYVALMVKQWHLQKQIKPKFFWVEKNLTPKKRLPLGTKYVFRNMKMYGIPGIPTTIKTMGVNITTIVEP